MRPVLFLRIFVPEVPLVHVFGEGAHLVGGKWDTRLSLEGGRDLVVGTHSVEEAG